MARVPEETLSEELVILGREILGTGDRLALGIRELANVVHRHEVMGFGIEHRSLHLGLGIGVLPLRDLDESLFLEGLEPGFVRGGPGVCVLSSLEGLLDGWESGVFVPARPAFGLALELVALGLSLAKRVFQCRPKLSVRQHWFESFQIRVRVAFAPQNVFKFSRHSNVLAPVTSGEPLVPVLAQTG